MKQLLTSGGVSNATIKQALIDLLGKPISQANALCIPTAAYGHPEVKPDGVWRFISGHSSAPMVDLGWQSVGVLELTALPTIATDRGINGLPIPTFFLLMAGMRSILIIGYTDPD